MIERMISIHVKKTNHIWYKSIWQFYRRILFILMGTNPLWPPSTRARKWKRIWSNHNNTHSISIAGPRTAILWKKTGDWKQSWCQNHVPEGNVYQLTMSQSRPLNSRDLGSLRGCLASSAARFLWNPVRWLYLYTRGWLTSDAACSSYT